MQEKEIGTFYLTDFLVRHFDRLIIKGLGLDRHPQLLPVYFGNYTRVVYLGQVPDAALERRPRPPRRASGCRWKRSRPDLSGIEAFLLGPRAPAVAR